MTVSWGAWNMQKKKQSGQSDNLLRVERKKERVKERWKE
jgi:hypothetical protein